MGRAYEVRKASIQKQELQKEKYIQLLLKKYI